MKPETQKLIACCQKMIATLEAGHHTHQAKEELKEAVKEFTESSHMKVEREQIRAISFGSWLMANRDTEDGYSYDEFENIGLIVQDYEKYLDWCEQEKERATRQGEPGEVATSVMNNKDTEN